MRMCWYLQRAHSSNTAPTTIFENYHYRCRYITAKAGKGLSYYFLISAANNKFLLAHNIFSNVIGITIRFTDT